MKTQEVRNILKKSQGKNIEVFLAEMIYPDEVWQKIFYDRFVRKRHATLLEIEYQNDPDKSLRTMNRRFNEIIDNNLDFLVEKLGFYLS